MAAQRTYLCIDLKSFYASVECVERGLDPMTAHLVVADPDRTEQTICLAVSPALKALGVRNRCRIFEIPPTLSFITARPQMRHYIDCSAEIYAVYLNYLSKEDIHVYSIDEAFLDVTHYLPLYRLSPRELALKIIGDIYAKTGIPAACGIGTNLYLAKIALDITAKHMEPGPCGARIGVLDEETYRSTLWDHRPITDFWRVGRGIAGKLARFGIVTMGQVARADEDLLYRTFGVDAELLIDHAWGREPTTIADIKAFRPQSSSLSSGQVLCRGYSRQEARLIVREMAESLSLELVDQGLAAGSVGLMLGYSHRCPLSPSTGTLSAGAPTSSTKQLLTLAEQLFDRIAHPREPIHRVNLTFGQVTEETYCQYDLFRSPQELEREKRMQRALLSIQKKYGKNAVLKGADLQEEATARQRNQQIGGHRA